MATVRRINLLGMTFNNWTVLSHDPSSGTGSQRWFCRCKCGLEKSVGGRSLRNGESRQCWNCSHRKHGWATKHNKWPEHRIWMSMIGRCHRETDKSYPNYGARGIVVCERWRTSFQNFIDDMGRRPSADLSLDRIDNNGNYEPSNCRWATIFQQQRNRRSTKRIEHDGKSMTLREWADFLGVRYGTLERRLYRYKWPASRVVSEPIGFASGPAKDLVK